MNQLDLCCGDCDRCRVVVIPLALPDRFAIAVSIRGGEYRGATTREVEQAGYEFLGHVMMKIERKLVSCAMTVATRGEDSQLGVPASLRG